MYSFHLITRIHSFNHSNRINRLDYLFYLSTTKSTWRHLPTNTALKIDICLVHTEDNNWNQTIQINWPNQAYLVTTKHVLFCKPSNWMDVDDLVRSVLVSSSSYNPLSLPLNLYWFFIIFLACLAVYVSQAWEDKPCQEKIQQLYYMMNNLLDTTGMDKNEPFEVSLQKFCQSPVSTPIICPSLTLLIAISYVERLNKVKKKIHSPIDWCSELLIAVYIALSWFEGNSWMWISNDNGCIYHGFKVHSR